MSDLVGILLPPLAAGLLATLTHAALGREVLARGIVFIDLAIAQCAALGLLLGGLLHWHGIALTLTGLAAALGGALVVAGLSARWPGRREALIGTLYICAAAAAALLAGTDPHGAEQVARLLSGDVLWTTWGNLLPLAALSVPITWIAWRRPALLAFGAVFYPLFAITVGLSLPLLGLYLVFATLIVPALAASATPWPATPVSWLIGAAGYGLGLTLSMLTDWPSGPTVVLVLTACGAVVALAGSKSRTLRHTPNGSATER